MIIHKEDSIVGLRNRPDTKQTIDNLGKQLSKAMLDNIKKDQIIASLGREQAKNTLELIQAKNDISKLTAAVNELKEGGN